MSSHRMRSMVALCALSALAAPLLLSNPANAGPADDAARFVTLINEYRAANGLSPLATNVELHGIATQWSEKMPMLVQCTDGVVLPHNPSFVPPNGHMSAALQQNFKLLRENVGCATASDVDGLHQAFLNSPNHRMNILDPQIDAVGLAVFIAPNGGMWVVEDFGDFDPRPTPPVAASNATQPDKLALRTGVSTKRGAKRSRSTRRR